MAASGMTSISAAFLAFDVELSAGAAVPGTEPGAESIEKVRQWTRGDPANPAALQAEAGFASGDVGSHLQAFRFKPERTPKRQLPL